MILTNLNSKVAHDYRSISTYTSDDWCDNFICFTKITIIYYRPAGAQVIPVFDSWSMEEMNKTLHSINGMLLPGGAQVRVVLHTQLSHQHNVIIIIVTILIFISKCSR